MNELIKREWLEKSIRERAKHQELLLALAVSLGAKTIDIEWPGAFEHRTRYMLWTTRRLHRKALELAIQRLEKV